MATITTIVPPTEEPVSLYEALAHCRVDTDADDLLISGMIRTARETVEHMARIILVKRTLDIRYDGTPLNPLPRSPIVSVSSIVYTDRNGITQTVDPSVYRVIPGTPGRILLRSGRSWLDGEDYTIRGVFGYEPNDIPNIAKQAILLLVGHFYEHREAVLSFGNPREVPLGAMALIDLLRWDLYA